MTTALLQSFSEMALMSCIRAHAVLITTYYSISELYETKYSECLYRLEKKPQAQEIPLRRSAQEHVFG